MLRAVGAAPDAAPPLDAYEASGVTKFLDMWLRIGVRRSSSSSRWRALAVSWKKKKDVCQVYLTLCLRGRNVGKRGGGRGRDVYTSSALSSRAVNSATTMLTCSRPGT